MQRERQLQVETGEYRALFVEVRAGRAVW